MKKHAKTIFIDRDGVINKDPGGWTEHNYVTSWKDFHFLPGAKAAIRVLNHAGYDIVVISNQAGVGRGFYSEEKLEFINRNMLDEIKRSGGRIKRTYYCIHRKDDDCDCRKPKTGLFGKAEKELGITARGACFIGDGVMDVAAGKKAGMRTMLVLSGKSRPGDIKKWKAKPDFVFKDLREAASFILKEEVKR